MKKITLTLSALLIGALTMTAQTAIAPGPTVVAGTSNSAPERNADITLTNSNNPTDVTAGGVACWNNGDGTYSENSFFRSYDLEDYGVTDGDFNITSVEFGQGSADDGKVLNLNIYVADATDLTIATLVFVDGVEYTASSADDLSLVSVDTDITVPGGSIVVFEVNAGDSGANAGETYFPGNNADGETALSYLQAADCDITTPTPVGDVAAPEAYVMNVLGDVVLSAGENALSQVSIYPNPASDVINIQAPASVEVENVAIYDVLGKRSNVSLVNGQVNVSSLANGVYILSLETSAGTLTQKIVKN